MSNRLKSALARSSGSTDLLTDALRQSHRALWIVALFSGLANVLMLTGPMFMLQVYDRVLTSRSLPTLVVLALITTGLYVASSMIEYARGRVLARLADRLEDQLSEPAFRLELADVFNDKPVDGRITNDLSTVRRFIAGAAVPALFDLPWVPLYLIFLLLLHWSLGLLGVIGMLIVIALAIVNDRLTAKPMSDAMRQRSNANNIMEAVRRSAEAVTALGMRPDTVAIWRNARSAALQAEQSAADIGARISTSSKGFRLFLQSAMLGMRISESQDSDSANSRTAVSLMSGQFGGGGPRLPDCRYG